MITGMVYLVGAGPGDPDLITVKGLACLSRADVVIYDRLVNRRLLDQTRPGCELIARGGDLAAQSEVNHLMAARARQGKMVVRLKGGDPFLFGRGGEEVEFLLGAHIPFEVVPGVSSALAVPASAGIPLTHRGISSTVTITTGHEASGKGGRAVDWSALCRGSDTLVILMGMGNLALIVEQLLNAGVGRDRPVAVICQGTLPDQRSLTSTLGRLVEEARAEQLEAPGIIVVGDVVRLRDRVNGFERELLPGRSV